MGQSDPKQNDTGLLPPSFGLTSKRRVLEGIGWRVLVESDFILNSDIRSKLLDIENALEEASKNDQVNQESKE